MQLADAALMQLSGQASGGAGAVGAMILAEGAVRIHLAAGAFAQDQVGHGPIHAQVQRRTGGALHALVRPHCLRLLVQQDCLKRQLARVLVGERGMVGRVPVLVASTV